MMAEEEQAVFIPWVEKYRPKTLAEVTGQAAIVTRLKAYVAQRSLPHMLLSGRPGCGKTTCVLAMARELYGDAISDCFLELNASDERGIDTVRGRIKDFARTLPISSVTFKLILLDEADSLTDDAQQALRRTMEKYSSNTRFCLNANYSSRIIEPIQSRCAIFRFTPLDDAEVECIVRNIESTEGLQVSPEAVKAIAYIAEGDARKAINVLQGAASTGHKIGEDEVLSVSSRARPAEIALMVNLALDGKFGEARKLLDSLIVKYGMSGEDVMGQIYREVTGLGIPDSCKIRLIDRIGEYEFRMVEGADPRMQLEALLAHMAVVGKK
ncbi:MAG: replication factor C small subunit [Candidatus Micrarchaeota archaeon]